MRLEQVGVTKRKEVNCGQERKCGGGNRSNVAEWLRTNYWWEGGSDTVREIRITIFT